MPPEYFPAHVRTPRDAQSPAQCSHPHAHLLIEVKGPFHYASTRCKASPCSLLPGVLSLIAEPPGISHKETSNAAAPSLVRYRASPPLACLCRYNVADRPPHYHTPALHQP